MTMISAPLYRCQVFQRIAEHFGVDGHTAGKAVRWFHGEP